MIKKILISVLCLLSMVSCTTSVSNNKLVEKVENVEYGVDINDNCYDIVVVHYENNEYVIDRSWHIPFEKVNTITTYTISYYEQTNNLYIYTNNYLLEMVRYVK